MSDTTNGGDRKGRGPRSGGAGGPGPSKGARGGKDGPRGKDGGDRQKRDAAPSGARKPSGDAAKSGDRAFQAVRIQAFRAEEPRDEIPRRAARKWRQGRKAPQLLAA